MARQCLKGSVSQLWCWPVFAARDCMFVLRQSGLCPPGHKCTGTRDFSWVVVIEEMNTRVPTLLSIIKSCTKPGRTQKQFSGSLQLSCAFTADQLPPFYSGWLQYFSGHAYKIEFIQIYFRSTNGYKHCSSAYFTTRCGRRYTKWVR